MLLNLMLVALPAQADAIAAPDMCGPFFDLGLPYGIQDVDVPVDGAIPVIVQASCGASGTAEVRLHRQVDGVTADEVLSVEVQVEEERRELALLTPDEPLLDDTDYVVVVSSEWGDTERGFSTGSADAVEMDGGAPDLEVYEISATEQADGLYSLWIDFSIHPLADPDALSYLEVFDSEDPSTPVGIYLPGTLEQVSGFLGVDDAGAGEACLFVVQTDGLGNVSDSSAEACAIPVLEGEKMGRRGCSTVSGAPPVVSIFLAMLFGLRRRRT